MATVRLALIYTCTIPAVGGNMMADLFFKSCIQLLVSCFIITALQYLGHDERFAADAGGTLGYSRLGDWRDTINVPPLINITVGNY